MSQYDNGGPAFPVQRAVASGQGGTVDLEGRQTADGMSLRDWFAGQALCGLAAGITHSLSNDLMSKMSYELADAMLAERAKRS